MSAGCRSHPHHPSANRPRTHRMLVSFHPPEAICLNPIERELATMRAWDAFGTRAREAVLANGAIPVPASINRLPADFPAARRVRLCVIGNSTADTVVGLP